MSDVWQGPGWWLASDGKWYPADAEPGAVYEGELQNESAAVDEIDPPAPEPPAPEPEPEVAAPAPVDPPEPVTPTQPPDPVAAEPVDAQEPETPADAAFGADPFAQMPAPVVEEPRVGGWQSVGSTPAPIAPQVPIDQPAPVESPAPVEAPEPVVPIEPSTAQIPNPEVPGEPRAEDDGWTSAYEERQDTPDVQAPELTTNPIPVVEVPEVQIPEVQIPEAHIPEAHIPEVQIPPPAAPVLSVPDEQVPDVAVPEVKAPVVDMPTPLAVENVDIEAPTPEVPAPPVPDTVVDSTIVRDAAIPIERDDAWRKPSVTDDAVARATTPLPTASPGVPDVVDLAIPDEPAPFVPAPEGRRWGVVTAAIASLVVIALLAWLITSVFNGDDGVNTGEPDDSTTVTEPDSVDGSVSPTSDATAPSVTSGSSDDTGGEQNSDVSVFALRAGDCIVGDIGAGQVTKVTKVECEDEHQFEVYREALIESSITTFDEEAISAYAEEVCRTSLEAYIPPDDERDLKFKFLQPTEDSWNQAEDPDRVITCLLFDDDAPLIGRAGP